MMHSKKLGAVALGVLGTGLVTGLGTAPAVATSGPWEQQHFDWGETVEDFCDVPGLTVEDVGSGDSLSRTVVRSGAEVSMSRNVDTDVYTNVANGRSATTVEERNDEWYYSDNGDGTATLHYSNVGRNTAYDDQGTVIARGAGSLTVESVWDRMGTPDDPDDDVLLSGFHVLKRTGQRYDFCGVLVPALS